MQRIYKGQSKNFARNEKVQIFFDGQWVDYTKPCGSRQVIDMAMLAIKLYGQENVKIVKINPAVTH